MFELLGSEMSKAFFFRYCGMLLILILKLRGVVCGVYTSEEGPFEVILHNTSTCLVEQPWFQTNVTVFNSKGRSLLRGTVVTQREVKDVKFHVALFYKEDNKDVKVFEISNQNCNNAVIRMVLMNIGLPFNAKKCYMKPVNIKFDNLNIDSIVHAVGPSTWYGSVRIRWEVIIAKPKIQLMCLDIELSIIKARDKKTK